jgi:hypothetical protein
MKQTALRPSDIVSALEIAVRPGSTLAELAERSAKSIGETHNAIRRLGLSALLLPDQRAVAVDALLQFIRWGVPYAFPATLGGPAVGWPTAILLPVGSAPSDITGGRAGAADSAEYVWPSADGRVSGTALIPLFPGAPRLTDRNPQLATMLSYVDLVRVGGARERDAAIDALGRILRPRPV